MKLKETQCLKIIGYIKLHIINIPNFLYLDKSIKSRKISTSLTNNLSKIYRKIYRKIYSKFDELFNVHRFWNDSNIRKNIFDKNRYKI